MSSVIGLGPGSAMLRCKRSDFNGGSPKPCKLETTDGLCVLTKDSEILVQEPRDEVWPGCLLPSSTPGRSELCPGTRVLRGVWKTLHHGGISSSFLSPRTRP